MIQKAHRIGGSYILKLLLLCVIAIVPTTMIAQDLMPRKAQDATTTIQSKGTPVTVKAQNTPVASNAQERIRMTLEDGIYTVPCEVNGLKLKFVFDTGAADVHLSLIEAAFMLKNGYIDSDDFLGTGTYSMADGSITENALVNLKTIKIGNTIIRNVTACISSKIDASLLLGQSAIKKLGPFLIDGEYLVLNATSSNPPNPSQSKNNELKNSIATNTATNTKSDKSSKSNSGSIKIGTYTFPDGGKYQGELFKGVPYGTGTTTYRNGDVYQGEYVKGKREGYGVYTFKDGEKYEGDWLLDHQHGNGTYYFKNKNKYVGLWYRDLQQGPGIMYYHNGDMYKGDWKEDKREGIGTYTYANGAFYNGTWVADMKEGKGKFDWADGNVYDGEWKNNQMNGKGTFYYSDGRIYSGDWFNNVPHGRGIYTYKNGDKFEGTYVNGERTGEGIFTSANGDKYTGHFLKGEKEGMGTMTWKDGSTYYGQWKANKQEGRGKYIWSNGNTYVGQWKNGLMEGDGVLSEVDGDKFKGTFHEGMKEGHGVLEDKNGVRYEGEFHQNMKNGQFIVREGDQVYNVSYVNDVRTGKSTIYASEKVEMNKEKTSSSYNQDSNVSSKNTYNSSKETNTSNNYTPETYEDVTYYLAQVSTDLNLREGPGTDYRIVSRIPRGEYVFLSTADAGQSFRKVLYIDKNIYGYVSKSYLINFQRIKEDTSGSLQIESSNYKSTADIKIENNTNRTVTIAVGSLSYKFSPHQTRVITDLPPGKYKNMASAPGVRPYVGYDVIEGGHVYSWVFYITTVRR